MNNRCINKNSWLIIPLLFLLYSAPGALDYVFHFPDEKYYTDSVLLMMEKDDYFTPYNADGTPRFLKPIITYWFLIFSYKLLGVSILSSRIIFWLAGAALIAVTFLMARSITGQRKTALLAAFVTAANPLVLLSASRSIPDILLTLFLTISAFGFLKIMLSEKPEDKYYWFAYLGAALAFETKGLPAAAFAGISFLFLLTNPWKQIRLKKLIHPYAIASAIIIAASWFILMFMEHGTSFISSFYLDQVGERVSSKTIQVAINGLLGLANLIAFTIPWIFIAFSNPQKLKIFIKETDQQTKAIFGFIAVWVIMIIIMSGAVFKFYDRYLLPVIPLLAMFFSYVIVNIKTRFKKFFLNLFLSLNIIIIIINLSYAIFILPDTILITGTIYGAVVLAAWFCGLFKKLTVETNMAHAILLLYFNSFVLLHPLLMPNQGKQLVSALKSEQITGTDKIYVYGNIRTASNIRIQSNNQFEVISMDTIYVLPHEPDHFLVFSNKEEPFLNLADYTIIKGSEVYSRIQPEKFPGLLEPAINKIKENATIYYIAKSKY